MQVSSMLRTCCLGSTWLQIHLLTVLQMTVKHGNKHLTSGTTSDVQTLSKQAVNSCLKVSMSPGSEEGVS